MTRTSRLFATLLVLASGGYAPTASAEPRLDPPKAIATPAPEAPAGTVGEPSIVLELIVGATGTVTSASVLEGEPPLAEMARQAALAWTFEPARRDDVPVSAKIRVRVVFRPSAQAPPKAPQPTPAPELVPPPAPSAATAPAPVPARAPAAADAPEDVVVRGARVPLGTRSLAPHVQLLASEVREIPGAFGDAFRAMEAMPGVTPIVSGLPYFMVRGAPPGDTGFFIDGVRVPSLFPFGVGEAVIHPGLVEKIDFYPGAYPARFGRFAGGILSGDAVPPAEKLHGEAAVRILDTGALLEAPFASGHGDALVSGRIGYPGLLLSIADPSVGLAYWDYQARAGWRFDDGSRVSLFGFGSFDSVSTSTNGGPLHQVLGIAFDRVTARYTRPTAYAGELRVETTVGRDRTEVGSPPLILNSQLYALAASWSAHPSEDVAVRVGADFAFEPYRFDTSQVSTNQTFNSILPTAQDDFTSGLYGELSAHLSPRLSAEFGARVDFFAATYPEHVAGDATTEAKQVPALDPRLSVRYAISRDVAWISALGVVHQASNIPLPIPALAFSQLGRGLQTAYQASEGVEARLPWGFSATGTAYLNNLEGLAQYTNDCPPGAAPSCATTTVNGRSYGLELLVRRSLTERLSGWLSYTFSRTERDSYDGATGAWGHRASEFDRPHVLNLIAAYDLGAGWRAGGRVVAYSGLPYSTTSVDGTPNARMSPFYRLDLRLEKRWPESWGHVSVIAEWLNVLLSKEDIGVTCNGVPGSANACGPQSIGPITVPSLGVEAGF